MLHAFLKMHKAEVKNLKKQDLSVKMNGNSVGSQWHEAGSRVRPYHCWLVPFGSCGEECWTFPLERLVWGSFAGERQREIQRAGRKKEIGRYIHVYPSYNTTLKEGNNVKLNEYPCQVGGEHHSSGGDPVCFQSRWGDNDGICGSSKRC